MKELNIITVPDLEDTGNYPDRTVSVKFDPLKHKRIDLWADGGEIIL